MSPICLFLSLLLIGGLTAADTPREPQVSILVGTGDDVRPHEVLVDEADHVKAFGVRTSAAFDKGLVVIDETVVAPPLTVERHGLEIRVNGTVVKKAKRWPIEKEDVPNADPGDPPADLPAIPPEGDNAADRAVAERWFAYWPVKFRWLKAELGDSGKALEAVMTLMKMNPQVSKVEAGGFGLSITDAKGATSNIALNMPVRVVLPEDLAEEATEAFDRFVRILGKGGVCLEVGPYTMSGAKPDHWQALAIAISGKPENERINALVDLGRISPEGEPELIRKVEIEIWRKVSRLTFDKAVRELIAEQSKP